ncbi:hypothetical protein ACIGFK_07470 [Streptomyces sp. NPDC085524]|uniref:hypothetical protein n=1 Tax=unclassified Streptomyces TaxID=2593676 RepID=UPI0035DB8072
MTEIAAATGVQPVTIRAHISRGRWPSPDTAQEDGTKLRRGATVTEHPTGRRGYRQAD